MTPSRRSLASVAAALFGVVLFVYSVRRVGVAEILEGVQRVGWGLTAILALGGLRNAIRAQCWRLCLPAGARLTFRQAFIAYTAGDAVGSVTPLGLLASEPTKIVLTRHHLATRESVASLALENLLYSASVITMVTVGLLVLLAAVPLSPQLRRAAVASLLALGLLVVGARVLSARPSTVSSGHAHWRDTMVRLRDEIRRQWATSQRRMWRVFLLDLTYHALAVLEVFLALEWVLGSGSPTLVQAVLFETVNRVVTVVFKFVPFRMGVDEAITAAMAPVVAVDPAVGVTLAVVRKVRNLFWAGVGLVFVAAHPARGSR